MSTLESAPASTQQVVPDQPAPLVPAKETFPSFALPEAVLHSIPLPEEFNKYLETATSENWVKTIFPEFFNPLFRRQGVVNNNTIRALESVGKSLTHLAREIESRDRVFETLAGHINGYTDEVFRRHRALAQFAEQLARQVIGATGSLSARLERETESSRTRSASLVAAARSTERRLNELQTLTADIECRILEAAASAEQHLAAAIGSVESATNESNKRTAGQLADACAKIEALQAASNVYEARLGEIKAEAAGALSAARAAAEQARRDSDTALAALTETITANGQRLGSVEARLDAQAASTTLSVETIEGRLSAVESLLQSSREDFDATRVSAALREDAMLSSVRALSAGNEARAADLDALRVHLQALIDFSAKLTKRQEDTESHLSQALGRIEEHHSDLSSLLHNAGTESDVAWASAAAREKTLLASVRALSASNEENATEIATLWTQLQAIAGISANLARQQESAGVRIGQTSTALEILLPKIRGQLEQFNKAGAGPLKKSAAMDAQRSIDTAQSAESDAFYVALEARFRGPKEIIRKRQSKYLPAIEEAVKRTDLFPPSPSKEPGDPLMTGLELECGVLDLGCGRGEWLDFLRDHGIAALGIDRNQFFLDACLKRKLRVMDADLVDFLRKVPDESIAVVTCFHVVEHMPMPVMQEVVRHIFRVLRRGGTAIFETPNPANLLTSCLSFLLDPTHLRPLHPELARFVLESSGFSAVHLEFLHPNESSRVSGNPGDPLVERFNEFFFGPQDYAAIGVKP